MRLSSIAISHGNYSYNNSRFIWNLGEFSKDDSPIAIITVVPTKAGVYKSSAFVKGDEYDPNMLNNYATAKTIVKARHRCRKISFYYNGKTVYTKWTCEKKI
ncbi:DUF11 domain-containing protein [Clostridium estertheticum]|uniref:DUF11 domain-containing protein n=1 Tax=Clostridium estertheticum TaxID=238834 RepID=UPI001CCADD3F|nr:DUF11 domain-containing protein [Clostridium estertheticum]